MIPEYGFVRDTGNSYVPNMTHHQHIDINGETTVELVAPEVAGHVLKSTAAVVSGERVTFGNPLRMAERFGRSVRITSDAAGTITIHGFDFLGQVTNETITAIVGDANGAKAFAIVTGYTAAFSGNVTVKAGTGFGIPFCATELVRETADGAPATEGTLTAPDTATPSATTGDVRGTYAPNTAPNGAKDIAFTYVTTAKLNGGLYGQVQA